jgi:hypothetical protein
LHLIEGKTDGHASIVQPAGCREDIAQRGHRSIGVAVLDQKTRLFAVHVGRQRLANFVGAVDSIGDQTFGGVTHAVSST